VDVTCDFQRRQRRNAMLIAEGVGQPFYTAGEEQRQWVVTQTVL